MSPLAATASAATSPTITSAFTPTVIGVGESATLAFTIADTNSSGTETGIGFTDALPSGLVVDSQNGESGTCDTNGVVTANPNSSTISLTAGSLKGGATGASGTNCVVSVDVTTNSTGVVSSSDGSSTNGDTETLAVAANPTLTVSAPINGATFSYGQAVTVSYSCSEGAFGPGLVDCSATDDNGSTIASGSALDTKVVGTDQDLFLDSTSGDGAVASDDIPYTVLPNNQFTVVKTSAAKKGSVTLKLKLPGAGKIVIGEKVGSTAFSSSSGSVKGARIVTITLKPSKAGKKLLASIAKEKHPPELNAKLSIAYTPKGGKTKTAKVGGIALKS